MKKLAKLTALMVAVGFIFTGCKDKEEITKVTKSDVTIHTYTSPEKTGMNSTHIIETKNKLVLVDAQFFRPFAKNFRKYADKIGKPINRIIISHAHPDHWFGLEFFKDIPIYSLFETQKTIKKVGHFMIAGKKKQMGDKVADEKVVPTNIITEGEEIIDGVKFVYQKVIDAEAGVQLLIKLPAQKTLIAQDLIFTNTHLFIGQNAFDGWNKVITEMENMKAYNYILAGHGIPTDNSIYAKMRSYINDSKEIMKTAKNGKELKSKLVKKYPNRKEAFMLDISSKYLFKKKK